MPPRQPKAAGGIKAAPQGPPPVSAAATPTPDNVAEQAYTLVERRVIDHRLRTPHRRHIYEQLVEVCAHWASPQQKPLPVADSSIAVECHTSEQNTVPVPLHKAPRSSATVNCRVLLCSGLHPAEGEGAKQHALRRIDLLVCNSLSSRHIMAYGGPCEPGDDGFLVRQLCKLVREQCGLDLGGVCTWRKFVELKYRDAPPTVFFLPALWELPGPLRVVPQAGETTVGSQGDGGAKRRRMGAAADVQTKKEKTLSPLKFTLHGLLDFELHQTAHQDTFDLCAAADALDEYLKREMALRIATVLRQRRTEAEQQEAEAAELETEQAARTQRRRERDAERKRQRLQQEEAQRDRWIAEDQGKTDDEKRDAMIVRARQLQQLRQQQAEEDKALEQEDAKERAAELLKRPQRQLKHTLSERALDALSYFDRSHGFGTLSGRLPRLKIENALLALGKEATLSDVTELLDIPQLAGGQMHIDYRQLAYDVSYTSGGTDPDDMQH
eukprot:TRINITY_DN15421_c1_g1_i1.p1 TRINITY_DN15421_c1_g1~~TRINITY_DN15421_c1_g1_i1.p1  ORF type:complete len:525 (+),score=212.29 TRINITY_DN15421_c1_g1_i1:87-1577(+)